jgi:hypothetical protein
MNAQVLDGKTIYVMESKPKQEPKQQFQRGVLLNAPTCEIHYRKTVYCLTSHFVAII